MDVRLKTPFTLLIGGPSGSGKTTFVKKPLKYQQDVVDIPFDRVVWCYGEFQEGYIDMARNMPDALSWDDCIRSSTSKQIALEVPQVIIVLEVPQV